MTYVHDKPVVWNGKDEAKNEKRERVKSYSKLFDSKILKYMRKLFIEYSNVLGQLHKLHFTKIMVKIYFTTNGMSDRKTESSAKFIMKIFFYISIFKKISGLKVLMRMPWTGFKLHFKNNIILYADYYNLLYTRL